MHKILRHQFRYFLFSFSVLISIIGCNQINVSKQTLSEKTLFERIGGLPVLNSMIKESLQELSTNPKTKRSFKDIKLTTLQESIVSQLCFLTGGGCVYEGETMKNSHRDAKITAAEFELFVAIHRKVFDKYIGTREKNELLKILAPMRRDIVTSNVEENTASTQDLNTVKNSP
jgi:hemoglobin